MGCGPLAGLTARVHTTLRLWFCIFNCQNCAKIKVTRMPLKLRFQHMVAANCVKDKVVSINAIRFALGAFQGLSEFYHINLDVCRQVVVFLREADCGCTGWRICMPRRGWHVLGPPFCGTIQVGGGQLSLHYKIGFVVGYGFFHFALSDVDMNYGGSNQPFIGLNTAANSPGLGLQYEFSYDSKLSDILFLGVMILS